MPAAAPARRRAARDDERAVGGAALDLEGRELRVAVRARERVVQRVEVAQQVVKRRTHRVDHAHLPHLGEPRHEVLAKRVERRTELEPERGRDRAHDRKRRGVGVLHGVEDCAFLRHARLAQRRCPRRRAGGLAREAAQGVVHEPVHESINK